MTNVTTARILADKAIQMACGEECVDWAMQLLESGHDTDYVARLAGMLPPHNHFEIADMRDRVLQELGQLDVPPSEAIRQYAVDILKSALNGESELLDAIARVKNVCGDYGCEPDVYDFYLLYFAHCDLQETDVQFYWPGATRENIVAIIRDRAEAFVRSAGNDA